LNGACKKGHTDVVLAGSSEAEKIVEVTESFTSEIGFRLVAISQTPKVETTSSGNPANNVEIQK
jgi:hypothetical protein